VGWGPMSRKSSPVWALVALVLFLFAFAPARADQPETSGLLTLDSRIAAQSRIERFWFDHREAAGTKDDGAASNPDAGFAAALPPAALREKVEKSLARSRMLRERYGIALTPEMLRGEVARMARETRDPVHLRELFAALGDDGFLIAETLGREGLSERLLRGRFDADEKIQADRVALIDSLRERAEAGSLSSLAGAPGVEHYFVTLQEADDDSPATSDLGSVRLPKGEFARRAAALPAPGELSPIEETEAGYGFTRTVRARGGEVLLETLLVRKHDFTNWFDARRAAYSPADLEAEAAASGPGGTAAPDVTAASAGVCDSWDNQFRIAQAPYRRNNHYAVWTGTEMIMWGGFNNFSSSYYTTDGARYNPTTDTWTSMSDVNSPAGVMSGTAVWTGTEMIVWGGEGPAGSQFNTGGRYNPTTDTWTPTSTTGAVPAGRVFHSAVWTGTEMILWGGSTLSGIVNTGGRYNPATDSWTATSTGAPVPVARTYPSAVWTGTTMVVWGGLNNSGVAINTGGRYNPTTNTWLATSVGIGVPSARVFHTAIWSGSAMIVWGGSANNAYTSNTNTGSRYNPATDSWAVTSTGLNLPAVRAGHVAVWTGTEMIVWGGRNTSQFDFLNTGGRYNPTSDSWTATPVTAATPVARAQFTGVWSGTEFIVWGGSSLNALEASGGRLNLTSGVWTPTATAGATVPTGRQGAGAVFAGVELFVWGGFTYNGSVYTYLNSGARYRPVTNAWTPMGTGVNVPDPRAQHTVAYVSTSPAFLLVYGGTGATALSANHGRYNPSTDAWLNITQGANFPGARVRHVGLSTGGRLIVWGGDSCFGNCGTFLNTGAYYNPIADSWGVIPTTNAPAGRRRATAVWSGSELVVWGGQLQSGLYTNTGAHYSQSSNSWVAATGTTLAPSARENAFAVADRTTLPTIIYLLGGNDASPLTSGARYDVAARTWTTMNTSGAPCSATRAVWTGRELIVMCKGGVGSRYTPGVFETWQATTNTPQIPSIGDEFTWTFYSFLGETYLTGGGSGAPSYTYPRVGGIYVGTIGAGSPSLSVARSPGSVDLSWSPIPPPVAWYNIKRCSAASGPCIPTTIVGTSPTMSYSDTTSGGSFFYTVEAATSCGTAP